MWGIKQVFQIFSFHKTWFSTQWPFLHPSQRRSNAADLITGASHNAATSALRDDPWSLAAISTLRDAPQSPIDRSSWSISKTALSGTPEASSSQQRIEELKSSNSAAREHTKNKPSRKPSFFLGHISKRILPSTDLIHQPRQNETPAPLEAIREIRSTHQTSNTRQSARGRERDY